MTDTPETPETPDYSNHTALAQGSSFRSFPGAQNTMACLDLNEVEAFSTMSDGTGGVYVYMKSGTEWEMPMYPFEEFVSDMATVQDKFF